MNLFALIVVVCFSILRSGKADVKIEKCSPGEYGAIVVFIILMSAVVKISASNVSTE